jgi:hypothetical protein
VKKTLSILFALVLALSLSTAAVGLNCASPDAGPVVAFGATGVGVGDQEGPLTYGTPGCVTYDITIEGSGKGGHFELRVENLPDGATGSFNPGSFDVQDEAQGHKWWLASILTICTVDSTPPGTFTIEVIESPGQGGEHSGYGTLTIGGCIDADQDGVCDNVDNCPGVANADQADADGDGKGDACDPCTDADKDGICDDVDNCPGVANADQADADGDGRGDACDTCTDADKDGVCDDVDNCPAVANADQADADGDGRGDACDTCTDADKDGICDDVDNCPGVANADQADADGDGKGDACDPCTDADKDGICDGVDNCPGVANADQADADGDGRGDACDTCIDADGDGYGVGSGCAGRDCDDNNPYTYPGAPELCDGKDNDCDGVVPADELDSNGNGIPDCLEHIIPPGAPECETWYILERSSTEGGTVTRPFWGVPYLDYYRYAYCVGEVVVLEATPDAGYRFVNWTGDVDTIADVNAAFTTITMNGFCEIKANFELIK